MVSDKKTKLLTQSKKVVSTENVLVDTIQNTIIEKKTKFLYKILVSDGDYIKLQEEIVSHLNDGWGLVGGIALAIHGDPYSKLTIFSQAIQKTI